MCLPFFWCLRQSGVLLSRFRGKSIAVLLGCAVAKRCTGQAKCNGQNTGEVDTLITVLAVCVKHRAAERAKKCIRQEANQGCHTNHAANNVLLRTNLVNNRIIQAAEYIVAGCSNNHQNQQGPNQCCACRHQRQCRIAYNCNESSPNNDLCRASDLFGKDNCNPKRNYYGCPVRNAEKAI